jgi:hypothetical protein
MTYRNWNLAAVLLFFTGPLSVHAAELRVLIPPNRYSAAHTTVPAVSRHPAASTLETPAAPDAAAFNVHVAQWHSFDVPAGVNGTQPAGRLLKLRKRTK